MTACVAGFGRLNCFDRDANKGASNDRGDGHITLADLPPDSAQNTDRVVFLVEHKLNDLFSNPSTISWLTSDCTIVCWMLGAFVSKSL